MSAPVAFDRRLAGLLAEVALKEASGIVTAARGKLKRLFCLERGAIVYAASNLLEEQFLESIVRSGLVSAEGRISAAEQVEAGTKLGDVLSQLGVDADAIRQAMEAHVRTLLSATLAWNHAESQAQFAAGRPSLDGEPTVRLDIAPLVLDYARNHPPTLGEVRLRIGSPQMHPLAREHRRKLVESMTTKLPVAELLERCDGSLGLADLVGRSQQAAEPMLRTIYGLLLLGVLEAPAEQTTAQPAATHPVTVDEVMARLKRAEGADYYAVLELNQTATRDEVRDAYYFLARRYHPDRFRSGPLKNLLPGIEAFFAQVTEAYNSLYDPALRAEFDRKRAADTPLVEVETEQDTAYLAKQNFARAKILIGKGHYNDALEFLENAVELDGGHAAYQLALGQLLMRNPRRRSEAEKHLLEAARLEPSRFESYLALGQFYLKANRLEEAESMFREVLRWEDGHVEATEQVAELSRRPERAGGGARRRIFKS